MTIRHLQNARPCGTCKTWLAVVALTAAMAGADFHASEARARTDAPPVQESLATARVFLAQVDAFIDALGLERERFAVRVNACEGRQGEARNDIYYIWIGLRGVAPGGDAADILEAVHAGWLDAGWRITRYRHLANGGVNVAATEPDTGNGYALDSGFAQDPGGYVVGYFNTPCYRSPSGPVQFGEIRQGLE